MLSREGKDMRMKRVYQRERLYRYRRTEKGAVLVVGLVILAVLMMGALAMMQTSIEDERIVANQRMQLQAFMTAEAGLRAAETALNEKWDKDTCKANPDNAVLRVNGKNFNQERFQGGGVPAQSKARYTVKMHGCASSPVLTSISEIPSTGARAELSAEYSPPAPPGIGPADPPAAISCFGGSCILGIKGGGHEGISGKEHGLPPEGCTGNACRVGYNGGVIMPAVYMNQGGNISVSGGGKSQFCGSVPGRPGSPMCVSSKNDPGSTVWSDGDYPDNADGTSSKPDGSVFFGEDSVVHQAGKASDSWGSFSDPRFVVLDSNDATPQPDMNSLKNKTVGGVMVIDGVNVTNTGTGAFSGLVIIKNCGSFSPGGAYSVYGAIIVDASKCNKDGEKTYQPFGSNGTPSVKYSLEAINDGLDSLPPSGPGQLKSWVQHIDY